MDNTQFRFIPTEQIGMEVDKMVSLAGGQRKAFERRWYNNNFFDDGYHYRFISRVTGRIVDLSTTADTFIPYRAIPKSSRQIRGIANLLLANEPVPVVYPEKISNSFYQDSGQYKQAMDEAKNVALKVGNWLEKEWKDKNLKNLLTLMVILTAKHGISYLEIWPDEVKEEIKMQVYDAFDIYLMGNLSSIYDSPFLVKAVPMTIAEIKANEKFDEMQLTRINPDNKYASSEIKEAYMLSRFGTHRPNERSATIILKEAFLKEYLNDDNKDKVAKDLGDDYKDKKNGDPVIRQVFEAGGIWLYDKYLPITQYPFIDFRMEPGPIYQVPLIERFIPANKSLDAVMSRVERHIGTMAVGAYMKRRGENYTISNLAGGQMIEYETAPPVQMQMAPLPAHVFNFINELNSMIEEQGATTAALGQTPPGVKSGIAIESLKATEYANLKMATDQLKLTCKQIAERMIALAADYFISPQTVYLIDKGQPTYFDIIGQRGIDAYKKIANKKMVTMPEAIPIKKEYKVDIEIQSGLGFTEEGKRQTMLDILSYMVKMAEAGYLTQEAVKLVLEKFIETFKFGSTQEFMEAMETGSGTMPVSDKQMNMIKMGVLQAMKDAGEVGPEAQNKRVTENKFGTLQALKESGLLDKMMTKPEDKAPSESLSYKDVPSSIKRQMEKAAGYIPADDLSPSETEQQIKTVGTIHKITQPTGQNITG